MKEYSAFQEKVLSLLKGRKYPKIFKVLKDSSNETLVSENLWNIIALVYETAGKSLLTSKKDVVSCKNILMLLMEKGNPNKMLLALLEQAGWFKDDEFFCLLLEPLQMVLKKTPGKRGKSLLWVLTALNAHIESHEAESFWQKVGELRTLFFGGFHNDKLYLLSDYLDFMEYFVDEVSFENLKTREIYYYDRIYNQQEMLRNLILKLLHHPFLYLSIENDKLFKNTVTVQALCEKSVNMLSKICHNVFNLFDNYNLKNKNRREVDADVSAPILAYSSLSHLIFVAKMAVTFQPFVYTHSFIFQSQLKFIIPLLKQKEESTVLLDKGLTLARTLINLLDYEELIYSYMDLELFAEFSKVLCDITADTDDYEVDEKQQAAAFEVFLNFANRLDIVGQYNLIVLVLSSVKQPSIAASMVVLYRKNLEINLNECRCKYREFIYGKNLAVFLRKACVLGKDFERNIFDEKDKIFEVLDLLKTLFVRDVKSDNLTGVWDNVQFISKQFLRPLSTVVDNRKTQLKKTIKDYSIHIKHFKNATKSANKNTSEEPHITKNALKQALSSLELIEKRVVQIQILIAP